MISDIQKEIKERFSKLPQWEKEYILLKINPNLKPYTNKNLGKILEAIHKCYSKTECLEIEQELNKIINLAWKTITQESQS